jgi:8-oxo-dGTP pyrophosphatase MutT (NUDIX family)
MVLHDSFPQAFRHYKPRSQKVYGIICVSSDDRILLVRGRESGIWSLPKGHIVGGELPHECALRELFEETGLRLESLKYQSVRKLYVGEYFIYNVDMESLPKIQDTREISEAGWYSIEELQRFHCNVDIANMMKKIQNGTLVL